ncbi:hypothetical protein VP01_7040g1, partial [Puccinia sorghi]
CNQKTSGCRNRATKGHPSVPSIVQVSKFSSKPQTSDYALGQRLDSRISELKETGSKTTEAVFLNQSNSSKQCKARYHNPKQYKNHLSEKCWHLHPEVAPEWWRDSQEEWKASKEKDKKNYFMSFFDSRCLGTHFQ